MPSAISDEKKLFITRQVFALYAKYGFDKISMDEAAAKAQISKATLYKYFKSKEDIVGQMVGNAVFHLDTMQFSTDRGIDSVLESIQTCYSKAILVIARSGSVFMHDLKNKFSNLYGEYLISLNGVHNRFGIFYENAVKEGYCKNIQVPLIGIQIKKMLPEIISTDYTKKHNVELSEVIKEYYRLLLYQILSEKYMYVTEQESIYKFSAALADILENTLLME